MQHIFVVEVILRYSISFLHTTNCITKQWFWFSY